VDDKSWATSSARHAIASVVVRPEGSDLWAGRFGPPNCQLLTEVKMTKKIAPKDNSANIGNANKGSPGTNLQHDQNQGNRGKQLFENQQSTHGIKPQGRTKGPDKDR
jgi:hypothetical protein